MFRVRLFPRVTWNVIRRPSLRVRLPRVPTYTPTRRPVRQERTERPESPRAASKRLATELVEMDARHAAERERYRAAGIEI